MLPLTSRLLTNLAYYSASNLDLVIEYPETAAKSFLASGQSLSYSRISKHFMEPEGSLQRL
jgi:hypothetical protein